MTLVLQVAHAQAPDINGTGDSMTKEEVEKLIEETKEKMKEELDNELTEKLQNMTDGKCLVCNTQPSPTTMLSEEKIIETSRFWAE